MAMTELNPKAPAVEKKKRGIGDFVEDNAAAVTVGAIGVAALWQVVTRGAGPIGPFIGSEAGSSERPARPERPARRARGSETKKKKGAKRKPSAYNEFVGPRVSAYTRRGMSNEDAMRAAAADWRRVR